MGPSGAFPCGEQALFCIISRTGMTLAAGIRTYRFGENWNAGFSTVWPEKETVTPFRSLGQPQGGHGMDA